MTGVADALLDRAPLVALTGQSGLERMHKESHQYIDVVRLMAPVTKWNARVSDPTTIPEAVRKAFKVAEAEKPGSTHLELPEDVMTAEAAGAPLRRHEPVHPPSGDEDVDRAVALLDGSGRPIVLVGNGVVRGRAWAALRTFASATQIPVAETFMGKGLLAPTDPRALGAVGLQAGDYEMAGFGDADVVVAVGYDLVEHAPKNWNPAADKRIICIDSLPAEIDDHFVPDVELVGDIGYSLGALGGAVSASRPRRATSASAKPSTGRSPRPPPMTASPCGHPGSWPTCGDSSAPPTSWCRTSASTSCGSGAPSPRANRTRC